MEFCLRGIVFLHESGESAGSAGKGVYVGGLLLSYGHSDAAADRAWAGKGMAGREKILHNIFSVADAWSVCAAKQCLLGAADMYHRRAVSAFMPEDKEIAAADCGQRGGGTAYGCFIWRYLAGNRFQFAEQSGRGRLLRKGACVHYSVGAFSGYEDRD